MADLTSREPKKAEHGIAFTVVCLGPGGASEPLAGIQVKVAPAIPTGVDRERETAATTDAAGLATFENLPFTTYDVSAEPEGFVPLRLRGAKDQHRVELLFRRGATFTATLTNTETGAPVADAYIQAQSDFGLSAVTKRIQMAQQLGVEPADIQDFDKVSQPQPYFRTEARSDAEGRFTFPAIPYGDGGIVKITIDHENFDPLEDKFEHGDSTPITKTYQLLPRTEIFGKVVADETSEPIPGAKVQAAEGGIAMSAIALFGTGNVTVFESVTDATGNYRLKRVPRGRQSLFVHYPGFEDYYASFEATSLDPHQHEIRLKRTAMLSGQVVDGESNPIEGVDIYWFRPAASVLGKIGMPTEPNARTAADGTFQLRGLPVAAAFNLLAKHPEFIESRQENLTLQPGEELTGLQFVMTRGGRITGSVVDAHREPIGGATLVARLVQPSGLPLPAVSSGPDGSFTVENTQPGSYEVTCEAPGYVKSVNAHVRDMASGVQFVMLKEAIYSGRFLDAEGEPLPKFRVRIRGSELADEREMRSESIRNKDGRFEVKGLGPGLWDFEFTAEGVTPLVLKRIALREGEKLENQELRAKPGLSVAGVVKSLSGKPVQAALVRLDFLESFSAADKTFTTMQGSTNSNGEFEVKHLLPGRYKVWATHPSFAPSGEREISIDESDPKAKVDFNLPKPASLRLIVRDAEGNTVPGAQAWLFKGDSPMDSAEKLVRGQMHGVRLPTLDPMRTGMGVGSDPTSHGGPKYPVGETGELTFNRREPGDWTIWVTSEGFYKYSEKLRLEAGKETVHEAELQKLEPGISREDAIKKGNAPKKKPPVENPDKGKGGSRIDEIGKLTPEMRLLLKKQHDGAELTAEEMKLLKEARKIVRDARKAGGKEGRAGKGKARGGDAPEGGDEADDGGGR